MISIRRQLLAGLLATVLVGLAVAGTLIYRQAQAEANEIFDFQLQQTAAALPSERFSSSLGTRDDAQEGVVIQIWSRDGVQLYYSHPRAPLAAQAELGFATEHTARGDWRVYSAIVGNNVVQLGQPMSIRNHLAAVMAWRTLSPLLVVLPVLALLVWLIVGRGLRPLARVARALELRRPDTVEPVPDAGLPAEIKPLTRALNGLLGRLAVALRTQRAFVADAAHELRTPLAALHIQVQLLERARDAAEREEAVRDLKQGVARATRLVEQLLSLARAEPDGAAGTAVELDLATLVGGCVAAYTGLAAQRGIDLGLASPAHPQVLGDADALRVMFGNLIDNALKYTPAGGRVDVTVMADGGEAMVVVDDSGPGIPPAERRRVFDRFYRSEAADRPDAPPGSGLGLAIVAQIAARHGMRLTLADRPGGPGLRVTATFPRAPGAGI